MIVAIVTVKTLTHRHVYDAIGRSLAEIDEAAREPYGDEPIGVTVLVQQ